MTEAARVAAPAKVNLALGVVGERDDGYHELVSLFLRVGLADELAVEPVSDAGENTTDSLTVEGDPDCPVAGNLVLRAAALVRERTGGAVPARALRLTKRVPVAAGLGGGSSDAASALVLLAAEWGVALPLDALRELALVIGSDVPFFTSGAPAALVTGRGETIRPLPPVRGNPGILLVLPADRLSTADVFAAWDRIRPPDGHARTAAEALARQLATGLSAAALSEAVAALAAANDLWPAAVALSPGLAEVRDAAEAALVRPMLMSGSGPALVAVYPSPDEAANAARELSGRRPAPLRDATIIATDTRPPTPFWRDP